MTKVYVRLYKTVDGACNNVLTPAGVACWGEEPNFEGSEEMPCD